MRKIVLTFGLIAGAILASMMLITQLFQDGIGFDRGEVIGYTTMVLAFLLIYFGVRSYRDNVAGGTVSFGRACQVGFLIMVVASTCYVAMWQFVYYRLAPDFMDKYAAYMVENAKKAGKSDAEIAAKVKQAHEFTEMYKNPVINIGFTFLEPLPVGVPLTLLSAWFLSRKKRAGTAAP